MSDDLGITSIRQVQRYIAELREHCLVRIEKRGTNFYFPVMTPDDMMSSSASWRSSTSSAVMALRVRGRDILS